MARITVEDCLDKVDNRFDLVMLATKRARQIATGGKDPLVQVDSDKATVIALREIAEGLITNANVEARPATIFEDEDEDEEPQLVTADAEVAMQSDKLVRAMNEESSVDPLEAGSSEEKE